MCQLLVGSSGSLKKAFNYRGNHPCERRAESREQRADFGEQKFDILLIKYDRNGAYYRGNLEEKKLNVAVYGSKVSDNRGRCRSISDSKLNFILNRTVKFHMNAM